MTPPKHNQTFAPHLIPGQSPDFVVLTKVLEIAFEKVVRRFIRRCLARGSRRRKGSEEGSQKWS